MPRRPRVAIAHDYLTQRGGAERVVASMLRAFPDATVWSDYGMGYVFIPVLLPLSALYWLRRSRTTVTP